MTTNPLLKRLSDVIVTSLNSAIKTVGGSARSSKETTVHEDAVNLSRLQNFAANTRTVLSDVDERMCPLHEIIGFSYPRTGIDEGLFVSWLNSDEYRKECVFFKNYPRHSLLLEAPRAFLYHCVRAIKPQTVIEIGTYKAGTAEIIARALWENGGGKLYTTDPYGAERCPSIISRWWPELQACVEFSALNSMDFFLKIEELRKHIDIAFIDGNHDYEFAYFDLNMTARNMAREGLVIMDNIEQQGPFFATLEFLRNNPAWQVLGRSRIDIDQAANPMTDLDRASLPGATSVLVLKAPSAYTVGRIVFSTGNISVDWEGPIYGMQIRMTAQATNQVQGELCWDSVYREFPREGNPTEDKRGGALEVLDVGTVTILFDRPFGAKHLDVPHLLEINLYFRSSDASAFLFDAIDIITDGKALRKFFP